MTLIHLQVINTNNLLEKISVNLVSESWNSFLTCGINGQPVTGLLSKISPSRDLDPILIELGLILWWCRSIRGIKLNVLECTTGSTCSDPMPRRASKYHHVRVKMSACPISDFNKISFVPSGYFFLIRSHKVKYGSNKVILNSFSWDSQISWKSDLLIDLQDWWEFISHEYFINSEIQINLTSARLGRNHVIESHVIPYHVICAKSQIEVFYLEMFYFDNFKIKRRNAFKFNA